MPPNAKIEIGRNEVRAPQFDDIYFCPGDGIAESRYVFLEGNFLPQSWLGKSNFCIVETGFGTGLNFLVTAQAWQQDAKRSKTLDYYSIEAFPIEVKQLKTIHTRWPEFKSLSQALIEQYPSTVHGCHSLYFAAGKIRLHLIFETFKNTLDTFTLRPDCWFLDGFAPSRNPSMWHKDTIIKMGECSKADTRLATFTAAGQVRRDLIDAGFEVSKRKGFGRKREMLCARKSRETPAASLMKHAPWFSLKQFTPQINHVTIIGAGIAGAQTAYHLAQNDVNVLVVDSATRIATGASGNIAGVLAPKLNAKRNEEENFYLCAFLYQLRQIRSLVSLGHHVDFEQNGLLQLAHNKASQNRLTQIAKRVDLPANLLQILNPKQTSKLVGEHIDRPALKIELAGALSPWALCQALLDHPNIECQLGKHVDHISSDEQFHTLTYADGETHTAPVVVIANGHQAASFSNNISLTPVRGQTSTAVLRSENAFDFVLEHTGYITPSLKDGKEMVFGATYQRDEPAAELRARDTQTNFESLQRHLPKLAQQMTNVRDSHAGIRASTQDRWPIVGLLPDEKFYREAYFDLALGKHYKTYRSARYVKGIYVLSGLGSRGLSSAGYCANILTHIILGRTPPSPHKQLHAIHPARFLIQSLVKNL